MKRSDLIWAMLDIDEDLIRLVEEEPVMKKIATRPLRTLLIAAVVAVLLAGTVLAVMRYTQMTNRLEKNWNVWAETEMTQDQKDFVENRSADIGERVTDQGITITVESVTCTADTAYLLYRIELDPETYNEEEIAWCTRASNTEYVENTEYGTVEFGDGNGGGHKVDGSYVDEWYVSFTLPDGMQLNDGKTVMHLETAQIILENTEYEDYAVIDGNWSFEFLLPESGTVTGKTSDMVLNFEGDIALEVSNITVTDSGCTFTVTTDNNDYIFANNGTGAEMTHAAHPDAPLYTVEAKLEDSTQIPAEGASATRNQDTDFWTILWAAPIDPETVVSLIFSDGTTEIEVPLH